MRSHSTPQKKREGGLLPGGDSLVAIARRKSRPPGTTNEILYRIVLEVRTPVRRGSTLSAIYTRSAAFL